MTDVKTDAKGRKYIEVEIRWHDTGKIQRQRAYFKKCTACGRRDFLVPDVDQCGPCAFGEASTIGGNW